MTGQTEAYPKDMSVTGTCVGDGQTKAYMTDMGMTGLASAWAMVRWRPKAYHCKVNSAPVYASM